MEIIKKYYSFLESLFISLTMNQVLEYLNFKKNNKVAAILYILRCSYLYKDDEDINFLGTAVEDNMITYLPGRKRSGDWEKDMTSDQRISIRVGRLVNKILEKIKPFLELEISTTANIVGSESERGLYFIDMESPCNFFYINNDDLNRLNEDKKVSVKISIDGVDYYCEFMYIESLNNGKSSLVIESKAFIDCPKTSMTWSDYYRKQKEFKKEIKVKLNSNIIVTDSDIEKFTNEYISFVKSNKSDETSKIEEVKGDDIRYWYNSSNYQSAIGKLGNSCMSHEECSGYLDIYVDNPEVVSLLILKNKNNKLVGRALLWKLDNGITFMDRIYTSNDSDDNIFINYAIQNGYLYRNTSNQKIIYYKDSREFSPDELSVNLKDYEYEYYPYIDTLCYLSDGGTISNKNQYWRELRDTEGRWNEYYDEND